MKTVDQWMQEYGESHKHKTNKTIHWICIPLILFSVFGILWAIPFPFTETFAKNGQFFLAEYLNWATLVMVPALFFYIRLSISLFLGFALLGAGIAVGNAALFEAVGYERLYLVAVSGGIFFVAWVGQFIGHNIEGAKPSFFKDLQFLLIGPAWLMHFIFKKTGIPYK